MPHHFFDNFAKFEQHGAFLVLLQASSPLPPMILAIEAALLRATMMCCQGAAVLHHRAEIWWWLSCSKRNCSTQTMRLAHTCCSSGNGHPRCVQPPRRAARPARWTKSFGFDGLRGHSKEMTRVFEILARVAPTNATVLILGESGTGKELVARAVHAEGARSERPFVTVNCSAYSEGVLESELFGHEKGAFTGAQSASQGLFRAADGGTIFLDEIAETSPSVQVKLLRVLQRGEIRPVGANQPRIVDVRIIAATNRDLLELVQEGKFREDLYYRLEVVTLLLPPLRDRLTDLRILADYFLRVGNRRHERDERPVLGFSKGAMDRLMAYSWPGNVRELENVIEGALALDVGEIVRENDLPERIRKGSPGIGLRPVQRSAVAMPSGLQGGGVVEPASDLRARRDAADRDAISQALRDTAGDKGAAAKQLGMARSTFYRRLKELGL